MSVDRHAAELSAHQRAQDRACAEEDAFRRDLHERCCDGEYRLNALATVLRDAEEVSLVVWELMAAVQASRKAVAQLDEMIDKQLKEELDLEYTRRAVDG